MKSKFIIAGFVYLILTIDVFGQTTINGYSVSGFIKGLQKDTTVYLVFNELRDTLGQTVTENGKFSFKGQLKTSIEWASVRIKGMDQWPTFLIENKAIAINGEIEKWRTAKITGSVETAHTALLTARLKMLEDILQNNETEIMKAVPTGNNALSLKYQTLLKKMSGIRDNTIDAFIKEYRNDAYTAWLIQNNPNPKYDLARKKEEYEKLGRAAKESSFGVRLYQNIQEQNLKATISPGSIAPDFKIQTVEGQITSLKELLPKYNLILVDFWASWCVPCRNSTPKLRKMQEAFQGKGFTILSISSDRNKNAWKTAIKEDSMDWLHGITVQGELNPTEIFSPRGIPGLVLVDGQGHILALDTPDNSFGFSKPRDTDAIYNKIAELLKDKN